MKEIIEHLRKLSTGEIEPQCTILGVCAELQTKFKYTISREYLNYRGYPGFSGNYFYPIKSTKKGLSEYDAFYKTLNLWEGEYGDERRKFCLWVVNELEKKYLL